LADRQTAKGREKLKEKILRISFVQFFTSRLINNFIGEMVAFLGTESEIIIVIFGETEPKLNERFIAFSVRQSHVFALEAHYRSDI
jgi:hypothetical protein